MGKKGSGSSGGTPKPKATEESSGGGGEMKLVAVLVVVAAIGFAVYTQAGTTGTAMDARGAESAASAATPRGAASPVSSEPSVASDPATGDRSAASKEKAGQKDDSKKLAKVLESEKQGRVLLTQGKSDDAKKLFEKAIKLAKGLDAAESEVAASAHMHLGTIFGEMKWFSACVDHLSMAHQHPGVVDGSLLRGRPWPFPETHLEYFSRMHTGMYKHCLHSLKRDDEAHEVFKAALAAGKYRNDWQCTATLSPVQWNLRATPWWDLADASNGAQELDKGLVKYKKKIRKESDDFFNHGIAPPGVRGVELNEELAVNGSKTWVELILWKKGQEVEKACSAVPIICKLLRKFRKKFHPAGQVKLSCMSGGTTATRHCGPCDTKLRMHHAVVLPDFERADIVVGPTTKQWAEGKSLLFDDSFEHTVDFEAEPTAKRVVLIADLLHPDVPKEALPRLECR